MVLSDFLCNFAELNKELIMHWSLIVLIVVVSVIVYCVGAGVCMGIMTKWLPNWDMDRDDGMIVMCLFFWIVILPVILIWKLIVSVGHAILNR